MGTVSNVPPVTETNVPPIAVSNVPPQNPQNYFYHYYFSHFLPLLLNGERKTAKENVYDSQSISN